MTPWTVARQAPLSMEFSRQEYWSGLPFPSPADLPNPGIEPRSPELQADALPAELPGKPWCLEEWCQIRSIVGVRVVGGGSIFLSWATILDCGTWEAVIEDRDQRGQCTCFSWFRGVWPKWVCSIKGTNLRLRRCPGAPGVEADPCISAWSEGGKPSTLGVVS